MQMVRFVQEIPAMREAYLGIIRTIEVLVEDCCECGKQDEIYIRLLKELSSHPRFWQEDLGRTMVRTIVQ